MEDIVQDAGSFQGSGTSEDGTGERRRTPGRRPRKSLEDKVLDLAARTGADLALIDRRLALLSRAHGDDVYTKFIHVISHLEFAPTEARKHWEAVMAHTRMLSKALSRPVDFRVGLADYFVHKNPKIPHPKVIDLFLYHKTEAGNLRDPLTGLYNYRYLQETLPREIGKARRLCCPLSLIFLDVDNFKAYNDMYGHSAGNEALTAIANVIRGAIRDMDLPCRYGGEEFTVLLPSTDKFGAMTVAERVAAQVVELQLPSPKPPYFLTASAGVASFPADAPGAKALIQAADSAMYQAKAWGKNRVVPHSTERRAFPRRPNEFSGSCTISMRSTFPVTGKNLSQSGLFFLAPREVPTGNNVDLVLSLPEGGPGKEVACKARVTRCQAMGGDAYGIGAAIIYVTPCDRLRFFQAAAEQRGH